MTTAPEANLPLELTDSKMEELLRQMFDENYATLRLESGHAMSPYVTEIAFQQVFRYWQRLRDVADRVTDTEVRLTLPGQKTPQGRKYAIEGVVDIVREDDRTIMYDIKTHDSEYVRANIEEYEKQLNVYAHIWQGLRGEPLDETAIIATAFPDTLNEAIQRQDDRLITKEMWIWDPLVPIPIDQTHVHSTIQEFGEIVDLIEGKAFTAPPVERLKEKLPGTSATFGVRVCRNCDARFSCGAYRNYARSVSTSRIEFKFSEFFSDIGTEVERTEWIAVNLAHIPTPETVEI